MGLVSGRYGTQATEKGNAEIVLLFRAVNQHTDADNISALLFNKGQNLPDRLAGGKNIIHNENTLSVFHTESSFESPFFVTLFFGKEGAHTQLAGNLVRQYNAAGGWTGNHIYILVFKMLTNHFAELFSICGIPENTELLPVNGGVQAGSEQEMPPENGAGFFKYLLRIHS